MTEPLSPDAWISIHTATETVTGPQVTGHAFGPFLALDELTAFEHGREDRCFKYAMPLFLPPQAGIKGIAISAAMSELMVLGALTMNWLNTTHGDAMGHDHHCVLHNRALEVGDPELCSCGWSTFYDKYLFLHAAAAAVEPH